jgi:hypothetical protein
MSSGRKHEADSMKRLVAFVGLSIALSGCASEGPKFAEAIQAHGMTQVALGPVVFDGCGNDRAFARKFSAVGRDGDKVEGVVCGGLLGPTVMTAPAGQSRLVRLVSGT